MSPVGRTGRRGRLSRLSPHRVFGISAGEGDGDVASTLLVLAVPLVEGSIYCWGLVRPPGPRGRAIRAFGWFGMLAGSIALISFSFVVWPLLLLGTAVFVPSDNGSYGHR